MTERREGRPAEIAGRTEKELQCYDLLDRLGIPYGSADHEAAMTMEICAGIEKTLGAPICKNLFLCNRQGTEFYLLLMPGSKPFKTKYLSAQLGVSRLSFGDGERMDALLGCAPGSASVLGMMNDSEHRVHLVIDGDVLKEQMLGCHPCVNTSSVCFSVEDLQSVLLPALGCVPAVVELPWE